MTAHTERVSEAVWQQMLLDLARMLGWKSCHVRRSIGKGSRWTTATSMVGWPDLVLMRPPELLFVELKTDTGKTTPEQDAVLQLLRDCGQEAHVWRPSDLDAVVVPRLKRGDRG